MNQFSITKTSKANKTSLEYIKEVLVCIQSDINLLEEIKLAHMSSKKTTFKFTYVVQTKIKNSDQQIDKHLQLLLTKEKYDPLEYLEDEDVYYREIRLKRHLNTTFYKCDGKSTLIVKNNLLIRYKDIDKHIREFSSNDEYIEAINELNSVGSYELMIALSEDIMSVFNVDITHLIEVYEQKTNEMCNNIIYHSYMDALCSINEEFLIGTNWDELCLIILNVKNIYPQTPNNIHYKYAVLYKFIDNALRYMKNLVALREERDILVKFIVDVCELKKTKPKKKIKKDVAMYLAYPNKM